MNNGIVQNGYGHKNAAPASHWRNGMEPKEEVEEEDPYAHLDDYFLNHPAASNHAYVAPPIEMKEPKDEEPELPEEWPGDPEAEEPPEPFVRPSLRDDAPLSNILHPSLDGIDPRIFFKDFNPNKVLRFSRLFAQNIRSSSRAEIWWLSRTFKKQLSGGQKDAEDAEGGGGSASKRLKLSTIENVPQVMLQPDEEDEMRKPVLTEAEKVAARNAEGNVVQPWRYGPARVWYDMMNMPSTSQTVNYGFKVKKPSSSASQDTSRASHQHHRITTSDEPSTSSAASGLTEVVDKKCGPSVSEDVLMPFQVIDWEKDVIIDGSEVKDKLVEEFSTGRGCGWIATQYTRTYEHFKYAASNNAFEQMFDGKSAPINLTGPDAEIYPTPTRSIFPSTPSDLDVLPWEENVIWDADAMPANLEPIDFQVDFQDDPLIYGMPEDRRADDDRADRKENQYTKKSKMILGQVQQRQKQEEDEQMESTMAQFTDKDPFNLSNDDYYVPKATAKTLSSNSMLIQHSTPATNIATQFFPTHPSSFRLRYWNRTPFTRRIVRHWGPNRFETIHTPIRHQNRVNSMREAMRNSQGGGEVFYMREVNDLSGKDEQLVMIEYSEEHPVVLSQPGMASKIRNYFKRSFKRQANDTEPSFEYGDMAFSHQIPFLGQLQPGQSLQSIENYLYRAPVYQHRQPHTDFLLIRSMNAWYIRPLPSLFVAGQQCPLYEVPSPNSKRATVFVRDFLFAFIYRLFWSSEHSPRRLKMEDVRNAFPHYAESNIRKRLKICSTFTRNGADAYWALKPEFRLPTKEEVLAMVTPEMCCVQYSMMAAEQRLKDAGYGEKYFFTPENDEASDDEVTIEDEIKCAPWNTTRAFMASQREKCLLDQTGIADPTGCGQGFSYVRVSQKPHKDENATPVPKKLVTGTNADLRKLPLKEAKQICRGYGVKEEEINALTRWEIIDVIRTLSTQAAKATKEGEIFSAVSGMARFARGNTRFSTADMLDKYRKHCQRIFDLQNQTLSNQDPISTDDDSTDADSDNEELASRLESMLEANKGKKSISMTEKAKMDFETEEREREDLKRMIHGEAAVGEKEKQQPKVEKKESDPTAEEKKSASQFGEDVAMSASKISGITANQQLKIYRTTKGPDGTPITRVEIVTRPQLIEAYSRIRLTRDDTFIQVYAQMDEQYKEEKRKKKRRLQDQIRRQKKNEEKAAHKVTKQAEKKIKPPNPNLQKMRCSACHAYGHMKTNRNCPLYGKDPLTPVKEEDDLATLPSASASTSTFSLSNTSLGEVAAVQVDGTKVKFNLNFAKIREEQVKEEQRKRKQARYSDQAVRAQQIAHIMSGGTPGAGDPDEEDRYSQVSGASSSFHNMGPGAIRNPRHSSLSGAKRRSSVMPEEDYLQGPAKNTNRIRADPKVTMSTMLTEIVNELKMIPGSDAFLHPVNPKRVTDYYNIVKNPISLQEIKNKITKQQYELRKEFLDDINLMFSNARIYNGDNNMITVTAQELLKLAGKRIIEREERFIQLEKQINPLLDTNDLIGFSYLLSDIVQKCKNIPKSAPFHTRVDPKKVPHYYIKIRDPMDLGIIENRIKNHEYTRVADFLRDIRLVRDNSLVFNGPDSMYTTKAFEIYQLAEAQCSEKAGMLAELERNINVGGDGGGEGDGGERDDVTMETEDETETEMDRTDGKEEHPTEDEDDEEMMEEEDIEMMDVNGEFDEEMWRDDNLAAGQILNDLAMSDSDEDERLEEMRRPANEDDNRLDSF